MDNEFFEKDESVDADTIFFGSDEKEEEVSAEIEEVSAEAEEKIEGIEESNESVEESVVEIEETAATEAEEKIQYKNEWQHFWHADKKTEKKMYVIKEILSYIIILTVAFFVAIFINMYVFKITVVSGASMNQTLQDGDTLILSKLPYIFGEPEYGDIVVFDHTKTIHTFGVEFKESLKSNIIVKFFASIFSDSDNTSDSRKYYVKRVIGEAGDTIEFRSDGVYRNGELLEEDYVNPDEVENYSAWEGQVIVVGEGQVFVMGDNRNNSHDSRYSDIGCIPYGCITGKAITNK